jgi:hypothetical protein
MGEAAEHKIFRFTTLSCLAPPAAGLVHCTILYGYALHGCCRAGHKLAHLYYHPG